MSIVSLESLSQEQRWGLQYELQSKNAAIEQANSFAEQYNANRPVNQPERQVQPQMTLQEYADNVLLDRANEAYASLVKYKQSLAIQLFNAASPEKQAQALAVLEVPDVLQE